MAIIGCPVMIITSTSYLSFANESMSLVAHPAVPGPWRKNVVVHYDTIFVVNPVFRFTRCPVDVEIGSTIAPFEGTFVFPVSQTDPNA